LKRLGKFTSATDFQWFQAYRRFHQTAEGLGTSNRTRCAGLLNV
jgi:hypothetical protein